MEQFVNTAATTLNGSINSSVGSLTVASASGFPTVGNFRIKIDSEIMLVTAVSGTTFTVTRGRESTTGASHTSGAAITHVLTAGSLKQGFAEQGGNPMLQLQSLAIGRQQTEEYKGVSVTANSTKTILNISGSGYVSNMFFGISCNDYQARERSVVNVYIDGEMSPSYSCTIVNMHCADYAPNTNQFLSEIIGYSFHTGHNNVGYNNFYKIPYSTSIKIDIVNGSSTDTMTLWTTVGYQVTPAPLSWDRYLRVKNHEQRTTVSAYAVQDLLNISGRGAIYGIYMLMDGSADGSNIFHYLEGRIKAYIDGEGTASYQTSGTEDYFMDSDYFTRASIACPSVTRNIGVTRYASSGIAGAYRFHFTDPIVFDSSIQITWEAGISGVATVGTGIYISANVMYYLDT